MKAIRIHQYGGPEVLRLEEVPRPVPGPGEALVRVAATAFNAVDVVLRSGVAAELLPLTFPYTPGLDLSGTVVELGPDTTGPAVGDAVLMFRTLLAAGAAADYVVVPADALAPAPISVPLTDAAALPVAGLTAQQALFEHGGLTAGQRVLINGAGGAVGTMAVQLAKRAGATVLATASPRSGAQVRAFGADQIIDYTTAPIAEAVDGQVDLLLNLVAGHPAEISKLTALVVDGGRAVSAPPMPLVDDEARNVRWTTFQIRNDVAQLADLATAVDKGELTLDISARHPLADIAQVQTDGQAGKFRGKVLLTVTP